MIHALRDLGIQISWKEGDLAILGGASQVQCRTREIFVANSGTTIRFLASMLAALGGEYQLDGIARMRQRPIGDLVDALNELGANVTCGENRCPPVNIDSEGFTANSCSIRGDISSQYLSGLLMAGPAASSEIRISVVGELVSVPYIDITLAVMDSFGVEVHHDNYRDFVIPQDALYTPADYPIEPDASAASYFFAVAAITGGTVTVQGLSQDAIQGDLKFCDCLAQMGCHVEYDTDSVTVTGGPLRGIDVDMNEISDTVPTLGVVALFAEGPTNIRNVEHVRHKETDRITDLARELTKLGARIEERQDGFQLFPGQLQGASIDTYNDHRMAMSFAVAGLMIEDVVINDPRCCEKTYPKFFVDLQNLLG